MEKGLLQHVPPPRPPWCSPWLLATLPKRAFLRLPRSPGPPPAPGRQSECHRSSAPPDSDLLGAVRTAPATDCYWRPRTADSRCSSRSRSLPEHSPPLADSSVWTGRPPCVPAPLVAAFRLAATDRSSPVPPPGLPAFVLVVVPAGSSVQQRRHNPAAFPSAHSPRWDGADAEVPPGESLRFPGWPAGSAPRLARSALPPALASRPTPRLSATAPAPATLALRRPRTCDWTCGLSSGICFSRRLSPLKGIRNPNSIRVRARAAASCSQVSTKPGASSMPRSITGCRDNPTLLFAKAGKSGRVVGKFNRRLAARGRPSPFHLQTSEFGRIFPASRQELNHAFHESGT